MNLQVVTLESFDCELGLHVGFAPCQSGELEPVRPTPNGVELSRLANPRLMPHESQSLGRPTRLNRVVRRRCFNDSPFACLAAAFSEVREKEWDEPEPAV